MSNKLFSARRHTGKRSSALIITLAALVLLSATILVFLSESTLHRQISYSSAGQYRADVTAKAGLDTILGDLRTQIAAGSSIESDPTGNGTNIYWPATNNTVVPSRMDNNNQTFPNLVAQSCSTSNSWAGVAFDSTFNPVRSVANNSTLSPSLDGRYIPLAAWNRPGLLADPGSGTDPIMPTAYTPPDWIILTRQGALTNVVADPPALTGAQSLSDKSSANQNYAIGRYAYTIYDEGGLLDVNVAGFPSSINSTDDFATKRGLMPQVNLGNLLDSSGTPVITDVNSLIQWRNAANATSASTYTNYVFNATNGFTSPAAGDQTFIDRQDLIRYSRANPATLPSSALQYLATFTRGLNAPSFAPTSGRPLVQSGSPQNANGTSTYGQDSAYNPSLINTRVTAAFTRYSDGSHAFPGEPLIKYRFPLCRFGWLSYQGNGISATAKTAVGNAVTSTDIYNAFGLTATTSGASVEWTYNHASLTPPGGAVAPASSIMTLAQVAAAEREPDFFELLQAGIMLGSLGMTGNVNNASSHSNTEIYDSNIYNQIIQIGANLIDQYDTDSYPTTIVFGNTTICGIENLPYIANVFESAYEMHDNNNQHFSMWYQPLIWNPHLSKTSTGPGPTRFRFITTGSAYSHFQGGYNSSSASNSFPTTATSGIWFSATSNSFHNSVVLDTSNGASATDTNDSVNDPGGSQFLGIFVGWLSTISSAPTPGPTPQYTIAVNASHAAGKSVTHLLQYSIDGGASWLPPNLKGAAQGYSEVKNVLGQSTWQNISSFLTLQQGLGEGRSDPRTDRFGTGDGIISRPTTADGTYSFITGGSPPGWTFGGTQEGYTTLYAGVLSENKTTSDSHYMDPDGTVRPADGAYTDGNVSDGGYPMATDSFSMSASRPVILDRPFRSVADMGYAFRDEPWKNIDFFTAQSADSALLDLFCINDIAPATASNNPVLQAGLLNLNTRQSTVLQAVLTGAIKSEDDLAYLSPTEAKNLAASMATIVAERGPIWNRSELVTRWISDPSISGCFASAADAIIKRRREAALRAVADIGDARTWNLLIDVIAQSGRYPITATNFNQFNVEGERRYWLHVSIDRYTNKVIAEYLEPVFQ